MSRIPHVKSLIVVGAIATLVGCKHSAKLSGLSDVKESSQKPATTWKDEAGGLWYLAPEKFDWEAARDYCDKRAKETKKRWRLPSPEELKEAITAGISSSRNNAFGWISLDKTWTASWENSVSLKDKMLILGPDSSATYVDMQNASPGLAVIDDPEFTTICVNTDANGSEWDDEQGKRWWFLSERMNWPSAEVSCAELARRKRQPWRLATQEELRAAVDAGIQTDKNKAFGRDFLTYTWSSEIHGRIESEEGFAVDLRDKKSHLTDVDEDLSVVCVRPDKF